MKFFRSLSIALSLMASLSVVHAWDYDGHRLVNLIAVTSLPKEFPDFVTNPEAAERIAFLAGEPDRWRNTSDLGLKHSQEPDHYLDLEELELFGLSPTSVSHFRYEFAGQLYIARSQHPDKFPAIDPEKNEAHTREVIGFLPWTINEYYGKLESAFSYLKTFEMDGGTPEEIANAKQNIIYIMGVMGHYAGDASQPLHATKHHHGWVGENPHHYATNSSIHGWIDGGYIHSAGIGFKELKERVRPAKMFAGAHPEAKREDIFPGVMDFLVEQNKQVEPLYVLNQKGDLSDHGVGESKGRKFITQQLLAGGQLLGDLWYTAWKAAPEDTFLKGQLDKRNSGASASVHSHNHKPNSASQ